MWTRRLGDGLGERTAKNRSQKSISGSDYVPPFATDVNGHCMHAASEVDPEASQCRSVKEIEGVRARKLVELPARRKPTA
jgi:hypothetical protein